MLKINVEKVVDIIKEAAVTKIMPYYKQLQAGDVREKKPGDFVTIADEESEKFLSKELRKLLPGSLIVGEESVSKNPKVLNRFKEKKPIWVIDPLDGTKRYLSGNGRFGILLSAVFNNVTQYGWIYDAIDDRMITTVKGAGVYCEGKKLTISNDKKVITDLKDMSLGCAQFDRYKVPTDDFKHEFKKVSGVGCSVEFVSDFLMNKHDVISYIGSTHPWDWAAAMLAIKEVGAALKINQGRVYKPNVDGKALIIAAPNKGVCKKTHKIISPRVENKF